MKFTLRKLNQKDLPQLLELFNTVLQEDFPEYQPRVSIIYRQHIFNNKFFTKFFKRRTNTVIGSFENNKLIAFLVIYGHTGGVAEFIWLAVDKLYRRKGIATQILKEGEKWLLKNRFHYLFFHTENLQLIEFYKKRGYEYVGLQKKIWFGVDEHLLQKVLRNKPFEEIFTKYLK